jgi:hypothetical protein
MLMFLQWARACRAFCSAPGLSSDIRCTVEDATERNVSTAARAQIPRGTRVFTGTLPILIMAFPSKCPSPVVAKTSGATVCSAPGAWTQRFEDAWYAYFEDEHPLEPFETEAEAAKAAEQHGWRSLAQNTRSRVQRYGRCQKV